MIGIGMGTENGSGSGSRKSWWENKEMFCLMMHSIHFIYGYMASDIL